MSPPSEELLEFELEARQLPAVTAVMFDLEGTPGTVQVLIADPATVPAVRTELERLSERMIPELDVRLELSVCGAVRRPLAVERELEALPGVLRCDVTRGPRGDVRGLEIVVHRDVAPATVSAVVDEHLGPAFPQDRISLEVGAGGS